MRNLVHVFTFCIYSSEHMAQWIILHDKSPLRQPATTQALSLQKVAKPPAKWCHSEEQKVEEINCTRYWLFQCVPTIRIKQGKMISSDFIWEVFIFFWGGGRGRGSSVYFFPTQQLQGKLVGFSRQTPVSDQLPSPDCEYVGPPPAHWRLWGPSCGHEQDAFIHRGE